MSYNKLIKTESEYNSALRRIEELFDAEQETPEADELELLVALVELLGAHAQLDVLHVIALELYYLFTGRCNRCLHHRK